MEQTTTAEYQNVNGEDLIVITKVSTQTDRQIYTIDDVATQILFHQSELDRFMKYQELLKNKTGTTQDAIPVAVNK